MKEDQLPKYLLNIRKELIKKLYAKGLSYEDISVIFSKPINRQRVGVIVRSK